MGLDYNVYMGWFAEFDENVESAQSGVKEVRQCPKVKSHPAQTKYCPSCGSEIVTVQETTTKDFIDAMSLFYMGSDKRTTNEEVQEATLGNTYLLDLKEFVRDTTIVNTDGGKAIIMAPGYAYLGDITRSDKYVVEMEIPEKPSQEWIDALVKNFKAQNVELKYGAVLEVG